MHQFFKFSLICVGERDRIGVAVKERWRSFVNSDVRALS
jgi:hypothetical protein